MDLPALERKLVCLAYLHLHVAILTANSMFIVDGISGGLPCGEVLIGRLPCNIGRYERELASLA